MKPAAEASDSNRRDADKYKEIHPKIILPFSQLFLALWIPSHEDIIIYYLVIILTLYRHFSEWETVLGCHCHSFVLLGQDCSYSCPHLPKPCFHKVCKISFCIVLKMHILGKVVICCFKTSFTAVKLPSQKNISAQSVTKDTDTAPGNQRAWLVDLLLIAV